MWPSTDGNHVEAANGAGHAYGAALFANERVLVKACVRRGPCDAKRRAPWWHRRPGAVRRVLQCRSRQLRWMAINTGGGSSVSANSKNLDHGNGRASDLSPAAVSVWGPVRLGPKTMSAQNQPLATTEG